MNMSHVNRSIFFGASAANSARYVARGAQNKSRAAHSQSNQSSPLQKLIQDRSSGFQLLADNESSEQYLWSAAWFAMFLLFLCTT
jgi:hypothetical protein